MYGDVKDLSDRRSMNISPACSSLAEDVRSKTREALTTRLIGQTIARVGVDPYIAHNDTLHAARGPKPKSSAKRSPENQLRPAILDAGSAREAIAEPNNRRRTSESKKWY